MPEFAIRYWNVADHLREQAGLAPHRIALAVPVGRDRWGRFSYQLRTNAQLNADTDALAHGLVAAGITAGMRVALMVPPSLEFFSLTFALFKIGANPVLIDPGMGIGNLGICLGEAAPEAFLGIAKAHLARRLFRWSRSTIRITLTTGRWGGKQRYHDLFKQGQAQGPFPIYQPKPMERAAILFTSGSTGVAKGAVYTHGIFAHQVEMIRSLYGIEPGEVDLCTFPLFALFAPALGFTGVIPHMNPTRPAQVDPTAIVQAIDDFGVTNLFGSPALLRRVGDYGIKHGTRLPTLRRVISAGAPVPTRVLERFTTLLADDVPIHTPYGATEALPVATIRSGEILGETSANTRDGKGVCVGRPVPGMRVAIIPISDEAVPEFDPALALPVGEIGEIAVSGPVVTAEYFQREAATKLAKMRDSANNLWHRMGDLGYRDDKGRIWFCGRKSQRVILKDRTLFTIPCEAIFNRHPAVLRSALVKVGHEPVICVELDPEQPTINERRLKRELLEIAVGFPMVAGIRRILVHPGFPVDIRHNAKIFREKLATWAAEHGGE